MALSVINNVQVFNESLSFATPPAAQIANITAQALHGLEEQKKFVLPSNMSPLKNITAAPQCLEDDSASSTVQKFLDELSNNSAREACETQSMAKWLHGTRLDVKKILSSCRGAHLPQVHWNPPFFDPILKGLEVEDKELASQFIDMFWVSQLKIAKYILSHPDHAIFTEGLNKSEKDQLDQVLPDIQAECKKIFPEGLPASDDAWNFAQKKLLVQTGAAILLFSMGKIKELHSYKENSFDLFRIFYNLKQANGNLVDPRVYPLLSTKREDAVIKSAQDFLKASGDKNKKVAIIFGAMHDFRQFAACGLKREDGVLEGTVFDPKNLHCSH